MKTLMDIVLTAKLDENGYKRLPIVSEMNGSDGENRFPVLIKKYDHNVCECKGQGECSKSDRFYSDDDSNSPAFCENHWKELHDETDGQSTLKPMNADELSWFC